MIDALGQALSTALAMGWEILWLLILGFTLSAVVSRHHYHGTINITANKPPNQPNHMA
jgi:hypothetical protein